MLGIVVGMSDEQLLADIFAAAENTVPDETSLSKLNAYVHELQTLERQLEENDTARTNLQDRYNTVAGGWVSATKTTVDGLLPQLMRQCGVPAFEMTDGSKVGTKRVYSGSISEANSVEAFAWLRDNQFGALIKHTFKVALGMGDDKKAAKLVKALEKAELPYEQKETVHPATLSSFIREQTEAGNDLPTKLLGIFVYEAAQIKKPKKGK
jgi:hypothetical protein